MSWSRFALHDTIDAQRRARDMSWRRVVFEVNRADVRFDPHPITPSTINRLDAHRQELGIYWEDVAREVGAARAQNLRWMRDGGRTGFPAVMRLARWLQYPAAALTRVSPW
jgi:hypothetical protein